jgi:hypothetical protein
MSSHRELGRSGRYNQRGNLTSDGMLQFILYALPPRSSLDESSIPLWRGAHISSPAARVGPVNEKEGSV